MLKLLAVVATATVAWCGLVVGLAVGAAFGALASITTVIVSALNPRLREDFIRIADVAASARRGSPPEQKAQ
jgi:hypothetical protein